MEVETRAPTLRNIIEQESLKWIFVGGKGGVGKTTTACSLAVQLAQHRKSVLLISTDPAHNLSDAFGQKFSKVATQEIDPKIEMDDSEFLDGASQSLMSDIISSVPGIDEAMSFAELLKYVQGDRYSTIIFDTAPTGHTLRLLNFPSILDKALGKLMAVKAKFSGIFSQVSGMLAGSNVPSEDVIFSKLESIKAVIEAVNAQFQDANLTTFVCVMIPEFLSLFETERLIQELAKFGIDVHNVVVNQVIFPEDGSSCRKCMARVRMQKKYLDQVSDLYEDFHVIRMPLLDEEVRGVPALQAYGHNLVQAYQPQVSAASANQERAC